MPSSGDAGAAAPPDGARRRGVWNTGRVTPRPAAARTAIAVIALAAIAGGTAAPRTEAAPRALAAGAEDAALAGDAALLARLEFSQREEQGRFTVSRVPLTGGGSAATIFRSTPLGALRILSFAASPAVVGVTATPEDDEQGGPVSGLFGGPAAGPLGVLEPVRAGRPGTPVPREVQADGGRLFVGARSDLDDDTLGYTVRESGGPPRSVGLPLGAERAAFTGDLVAYATERGRPSPALERADAEGRIGPCRIDAASSPQRLVVAEWRTGVQRATAAIPTGIESLDVSPSGAVAVGEPCGGVLELRPGRGLRRVTGSNPPPWPGLAPRFAGERIVFVRGDRRSGLRRLIVAEPDTRSRTFGVPSFGIASLDADERRVLWRANGCTLVADVQAPPARAPAAGPCARTDVSVERGAVSGPRTTVRRGRRVAVRLACAAAPPPGCRGTLRLATTDGDGAARVSSRVRFQVRVGDRRRIVVRLTRRAHAALRSGRSTQLTAIAVTVDPDGRRARHEGQLTVSR